MMESASSYEFKRFDYGFYCELLRKFQQTHQNLCFSDLRQTAVSENYFIVRHDVDFSPDAALEMARREAQIGIRASYFLLFASPFYNLLSERHRDFPRQLTDLGHEVGLHYDVRAYSKVNQLSLLCSLRAEAELLGLMSGTEVTSIAMHNPSVFGEDPFKDSQEFTNAYAEEFTKDITYLSDSSGAWRDSTVLALGGNIPPRFQLLIHPIFWGQVHVDRWERLDNATNAAVREVTDFAELSRSLWAKSVGVQEHERRQRPNSGSSAD